MSTPSSSNSLPPGTKTVAAYYFPGYHPDPRNDRRYGANWTEWRLLAAARPRFPGHVQPRIPLWGSENEAEPAVMARKIAAAADHALDVFLFDWYWYNGPFLNGALDSGFLGAPNRDRVKFALMWANHNWTELFPRRLNRQQEIIYPGPVNRGSFDAICDHVIGRYFAQPNYWRVDGRPYFSIYDLQSFLAGFGHDLAAAVDALRRFREKATAAGVGGLHLNLIFWEVPVLPGTKATAVTPGVVRELGFDSITSYVWIHHVPLDFPTTPFDRVFRQMRDYTLATAQAFAAEGIPYFPNVSVGWDSSPRTDQEGPWEEWEYPFIGCLSNASPERFRDALRWARDHNQGHPDTKGVVTINSWNEWTEGSYLEPDTTHRYAYLEAIRDVFGANGRHGS